MRKVHTLLCGLIMLAGIARAVSNEGMPFGSVTEQDVENLNQFAKGKGLDLVAEVKAVDGHNEEALAKIFRFSLQFDKLDQNARTYGQIIYSSMLNLGEAKWLPTYARVLEAQSAEVQQRIRDFLFYPVTLVPAGEREQVERETRKDMAILFPSHYRFGAGHSLWSGQ
jgi:hypothetical protein